MTIPSYLQSPLQHLQVSKELVLEFFAVFSRFEHALKATGYWKKDKHGNVTPDWKGFSSFAHAWFDVTPDGVHHAIVYLLGLPPHRQIVKHGTLDWEVQTFNAEDSPAVAVLEAVKIVRNNLFHGGKHTPHSPPGRDEKLVRSALCMLRACLKQDRQLAAAYEQPTVL